MKRRQIKIVDVPDIELVKCPCCKAKPEVLTELGEYNVECINEACMMIVRTQWVNTLSDAVSIWNKMRPECD